GDTVTEAADQGTDTIESLVSFTLGAHVENLRLFGSGNIDATGNELANIIEGNGSNNRIDGGAGADYLLGYGGNDIYIVDHAGDVVGEAANEGTDSVEASVSYTLGSNVENLTLTGSGNINGTGNGIANSITSNAGNNRLTGGAGNDFVYQISDGSRDIIDGGDGTDTYELLGDAAVIERFTIYDRASAIAASFGAGLEASSMIVVVRETRATNNTEWTGATVIAELRSIEEIVVKTSGNGPAIAALPGTGVDPTAAGDTIRIIGDFEGTGLAYNTITVEGGDAAETVDISALSSAHRVVFNAGGGSDAVIGIVRPQDIVNTGTPSNGHGSVPPTPAPTTTTKAVDHDSIMSNLRSGAGTGERVLMAGLPPGADPFEFYSQGPVTPPTTAAQMATGGADPAAVSQGEQRTAMAVEPLDRLLALIRQDMAAFDPIGASSDLAALRDTRNASPDWIVLPGS
ncbi:MAG: hypothetical protein RL481_1370, partial [Pseudomonadota bacterium]